jgi:hypothetical protein
MSTDLQQYSPALAVSQIMFEPAKLQAVVAFAEMMSQGSVTVPRHFQGKPSDCMAMTLQAMRWGMDPYVVAQKTHMVNEKLGYEAQLIIAILQNSGAVRGRPHYEYKGSGPTLECRAGFIPAGENEIVWTEWLASREITVKNSPLWKTNPAQQMGYVQARNWARLYAPGAILGVYTDDELEVLPPAAGPRRELPPADVVQPPARPPLPDYSDEQMAANLPSWGNLVASGRKTASELLAMLSTKANFTEEQKARILSLGAATAKANDDFNAPNQVTEGAGQ